MPRPTRCVPHTRLWRRQHEICAKLCPAFRGLFTYLGSGVMIDTDFGGLVHYQEGNLKGETIEPDSSDGKKF